MTNSTIDKAAMVKEVLNVPDLVIKALSKMTGSNAENGVHVLSVDADTFEQTDMPEELKQLIRSTAPEGFLKAVDSKKVEQTTSKARPTAKRYTGLELLQNGEYGMEYTCKTDGELYNAVVIRQQGGGYINKRTGTAVVADNTFLKGKFIATSKEREGKFINEVLVEEVSMNEAIAAYKNGADAWAEFVVPCFCGKCEKEIVTASFEEDFSSLGSIDKLVEETIQEQSSMMPSFIRENKEIMEDLKAELVEDFKEDSQELRLQVAIPLPAITDGKFFIPAK